MFKPAGQANFPQMEQDTLAFWEQNNTFEKSKENRKGAPEFICLLYTSDAADE